jgi:hypothetical protein
MPSRNRGKLKLKLRDLSRFPPTKEERDALTDALAQETVHPIAAAIVGAVMIEHQLESMLQGRLPRKDDDTWETLITEDGPFRSFSTKIAMGYAFRMYDEKTRDALHIIRHIRNAFAHSKKLIEFDHPLIIAELQKAASLRGIKRLLRIEPINTGARLAYVSICFQLSTRFFITESRRYRASSRWYKRKMAPTARQNPFAAALMPFLLPQTGGQVSGLALYPGHQTGGPTPGVHATPQTRLREMVPTPARNKDK